MRAERALLIVALLLAQAGCHRGSRAAQPSPLPPLGVVQSDSVRPRDPLPLPPADTAEQQRITLTAVNADVRALLLTLAEAAGVSLAFGPEVEGRISVRFDGVPALEALRLVLDQAGLSVVAGPPRTPWGPTVFYALPVNVNEASEEMLRSRFGISPEVARWIVESRKRR